LLTEKSKNAFFMASLQQGLFSYIYIEISRLQARNFNIRKLNLSVLPKANLKFFFKVLKPFGPTQLR